MLNASQGESREVGEGVRVEYDSLSGINYNLAEGVWFVITRFECLKEQV